MTGGPYYPPAVGLGFATGLLVLVGRPAGMEHLEVGIGAMAFDAVEWLASLILYLILCVGVAAVRHVLAEQRSTRTVGGKA